MPLPANFSNFGGSRSTAALQSRQDNFASFTPPPPPPKTAPEPPPATYRPPPIPPSNPTNPTTPTNFTDPKTIPNDAPCDLQCDDSDGCYCPVPVNDPVSDPFGGDMLDSTEDQTAADDAEFGDGTATQSDVDKAVADGNDKVKEIVDTAHDIAEALQVANAAANLLNLGNALMNGIPLANDATKLTGDVNQLKLDSLQLQANVNIGIDTLNQGIANRNMGQIQDGFNKLEAASKQADSLSARGAEIQARAESVQSRAESFEKTTNIINSAAQGLTYGAQSANLFGQGYQAAVNPTAENLGNVFASAAQTSLKVASDFTSFVSPIGGQIAGSAIAAGQTMGVQAGQGASPSDIALGAVSFFGGSAYNNAKQANYYAGQGNDARAAEYATYAALDVAQIAATASGVGAPVGMVGIPLAKGFTAFGSDLAQGGSFEHAAVYGTDVGLANSAVGKILNAANMITGAKQGEDLWFNAQQPATGAIRTIEAPLASTTLSMDSTGRLRYNYNPSLGAEFRAQGALVQQIQPAGTTFDSSSLAVAAQRQAAIRAQQQLGSGIAHVNFAKE